MRLSPRPVHGTILPLFADSVPRGAPTRDAPTGKVCWPVRFGAGVEALPASAPSSVLYLDVPPGEPCCRLPCQYPYDTWRCVPDAEGNSWGVPKLAPGRLFLPPVCAASSKWQRYGAFGRPSCVRQRRVVERRMDMQYIFHMQPIVHGAETWPKITTFSWIWIQSEMDPIKSKVRLLEKRKSGRRRQPRELGPHGSRPRSTDAHPQDRKSAQ